MYSRLALVIPFVMKALKTDVKQGLGRKISVICCACMIAFAVNYPLNVILTFDDAIHENVTVTKKSINSYRGALNVNQKGGEDLYSISERHYLYAKQTDSVKKGMAFCVLNMRQHQSEIKKSFIFSEVF